MAGRNIDGVAAAPAGRIVDMLRYLSFAGVGFALGREWGGLRREGGPAAVIAPGKRHASASAVDEVNRGRRAESPTDISLTGWQDIGARVYAETLEDRIPTVAAGIAFYCLLAIFPAIAALVSLYGIVADPATIRDHLATLSFALPSGAFQIVEDQISRIVTQSEHELGIKLVISFLISVWGANAGMKAVIDGLNVAYEERERRSFINLNLAALALTAGAFCGLLAIMACVAVAPAIVEAVGLPASARTALDILRWPLMFVLLTAGLSVLYRFGPSRDRAKWRWVSWGACLAALLWVAISLLFSWYLTHFADYNKIYGSLGAAIGLMTWMWLSACAVLVGAELNAEMEHQTMRDTTSGAERPMGLRGARMADTLGKSR